jgi:DNA-binding NtrC family response regulator
VKATILLIDDDPVDLQALKALVESWDNAVVAVRSGEEGVAQLEDVSFDLVLSDVCMPGMTGEEVVKAVAKASPGLPVVLITGRGDVKSAVSAMKIGAFDYVVKPPDIDELRLTVGRALEHSRLRRENRFLRAELAAGGMYGERMIGRSPGMLEVFELVNRVARAESTVLISGETGTGKELVAQAIHYRSARCDRPLVALNCASLQQNLVESELFGHEKGAFTGAVAMRRGRFEDADGGTLFLDEIGEISPAFQAKLLRVLQEGEFERVGGSRSVRVDVRIVVSTNRDLAQEVRDGSFREDLYYRLSVIPIRIPPLRERRADIPLLAAHFVDTFAKRYGLSDCAISDAGMEYLRQQSWPGNVRELQHVIERAVVLGDGRLFGPDDFRFGDGVAAVTCEGETLQDYVAEKTREYVVRVLDGAGWRKGRAARALGVDRATLYRMIRKYRIEEEDGTGRR